MKSYLSALRACSLAKTLSSELYSYHNITFSVHATCGRKEFRKEFFRLEEVCSLIPSDVHLMALTEICKVLSMKKPKTYHPLLKVQSLFWA